MKVYIKNKNNYTNLKHNTQFRQVGSGFPVDIIYDDKIYHCVKKDMKYNDLLERDDYDYYKYNMKNNELVKIEEIKDELYINYVCVKVADNVSTSVTNITPTPVAISTSIPIHGLKEEAKSKAKSKEEGKAESKGKTEVKPKTKVKRKLESEVEEPSDLDKSAARIDELLKQLESNLNKFASETKKLESKWKEQDVPAASIMDKIEQRIFNKGDNKTNMEKEEFYQEEGVYYLTNGANKQMEPGHAGTNVVITDIGKEIGTKIV